jgi:hypothetical protein
VGLAVRGQPARDLVGGFSGHVETGTIGDHVGSWFWVRCSLARTDLSGQDPTPPTRHAPFTTPLLQATRCSADQPPARKPQSVHA